MSGKYGATHPLPPKMVAKTGSWISCGKPVGARTHSGRAASLFRGRAFSSVPCESGKSAGKEAHRMPEVDQAKRGDSAVRTSQGGSFAVGEGGAASAGGRAGANMASVGCAEEARDEDEAVHASCPRPNALLPALSPTELLATLSMPPASTLQVSTA